MKVLVLKEDKKAREQLVMALQSELFIVDSTSDRVKGSYLARTNEYDIVIVGDTFAKASGLDICRELRDHDRHMSIIILTRRGEAEKKVEILDAGADDCLSKPYLLRELLSRMNALVRRSSLKNSAHYKAGDLTLRCDSQQACIKRRCVHLTTKEFLLLELLLLNKGRVVSRGTIMEHVWKSDVNPFSKAIETHIMNIRKKVGSCRDLIYSVPGRGYKITD